MSNETTHTKTKVGVFDSGIGGFSVLKELRDNTTADVLYFGDCARAPYGNRTTDEIVLFIKEIIHNLKAQDVTHFVSACNSMSVMTTDRVLAECGIEQGRYVDVLRAFKSHATFNEGSRVLVLGTHATIASGAYQEVLRDKNIEVEVYAYKALAGAIEKEADEQDLYELVLMSIIYAREKNVTHILYGCTHYPLVDAVFKRCAKDFEWDVTFVDPAVYVGKAVNIWGLEGEKSTVFEASEVTDAFKKLSNKYAI